MHNWRKPSWLKPPATLFFILFLLALVSISALGWFGWRLFEQDRLVEAQRSRERLEQAADRIATTLHSTLAVTGDRLGEWETASPNTPGLVLHIQDETLTVVPPGRLLYSPFASAQPEASAALFAEAEELEFAQKNPREALAIYQRLMESPEAPTRAGALLRAARVLRNLEQWDASRALYRRLAAIRNANVAGAPAEVVALEALCELGSSCQTIADGLRQGRWQLTQGQFEFYSSQAHAGGPAAEALAFAQAASRIWDERTRNLNQRGQETVWIGDHAYFLLWRGTPEHRAVLITQPEALLSQIAPTEGIRYAISDNDA